jgi:threonine/homoserine/homoserine lactone efflux protein
MRAHAYRELMWLRDRLCPRAAASRARLRPSLEYCRRVAREAAAIQAGSDGPLVGLVVMLSYNAAVSPLLTDVLSFAAVAGLLTIVPGLDTAMVLRSAAANGRRHGFATALGVNSGALVWGAGAAVGVSALLTASTVGYTIVRIAGAVYMIWLGSRLVLRALQGHEAVLTPLRSAAGEPTLARSWSRGLTTNLLNPKIGAFYVAVLPQFIPPHASHLAVGLLLALVHDVEGLVWFTAIILGVHSARALFERRQARRGIDGITGATLIGFGIKLGLSSK